MRQFLGETRSSVKSRHALISPDSHEKIELPHWPGTEVVFLITPDMGARFSLFEVKALVPTEILPPPHKGARFILVRQGEAMVVSNGQNHQLSEGDYAYLPHDEDHQITLAEGAGLLCLERRYVAISSAHVPTLFVSSIAGTSRSTLRGDTRLQIQKLLPDDMGFDMEINVMEFEPGTTLPYVETHFMEHGLMMLDGGGVYRLDESWYPVMSGDVIWMGPFCPQWFGALGRENARYLIYKNWNRDPMVG